MSAKRASNELRSKNNVNPSIARQNEATAEDFQELSEIIDNHADIIDTIYNDEYRSEFHGFFGNLSLLKTKYPNAKDKSYALLLDSNGQPKKIAKWDGNDWVVSEESSTIILENDFSKLPDQGSREVFYFVKNARKLYLWYDSQYNSITDTSQNSLRRKLFSWTSGSQKFQIENSVIISVSVNGVDLIDSQYNAFRDKIEILDQLDMNDKILVLYN